MEMELTPGIWNISAIQGKVVQEKPEAMNLKISVQSECS